MLAVVPRSALSLLLLGVLAATVLAASPEVASLHDSTDVISQDEYNAIFPNMSSPACTTGSQQTASVFSYDNFVAAMNAESFAATGTLEQRRAEIAMFLANMSQETFGGWAAAPGGPLAWGGCFGTESGCYKGDDVQTPCTDYSTGCPAGQTCNAVQGYYGRGPLQLSYPTNYYNAAAALKFPSMFSDPNSLLKDPVMLIRASMWFWNNATGSLYPGVTCSQAAQAGDFTKTIAIINGGIECNIEPTAGLGQTEFMRRNHFLKSIAAALNIPLPDCSASCNAWAATNNTCYSCSATIGDQTLYCDKPQA